MDLGKTMDMSPGPMPPMSEVKPAEKHYPNVCLDMDGEDAMDFPKSGTVTFKFERMNKSVNTSKMSDKPEKTTSSVCLKMLMIVDLEPEDESPKKDDRASTEESLDSYAKDLSAEKGE